MAITKQARAHEQRSSPPGVADDLLAEELSKVLPKDIKFGAYHLSTPPTLTEALYPPPAQPATLQTKSPEGAPKDPRPTKPLKTYCEKHFLAVSINAPKPDTETESQGQVLVLALEIYIFTTSFSTTIFVAKADSTGYLTLLNLPKGTPSPIREVTAAFVAFLVTTRRRPNKQLVVNLFARSQSQYLFPGSVKNPAKHILDDRGLVKWWCRVLSSLLDGKRDLTSKALGCWDRVHGYIVVPGLDDYETRFFLPRSETTAANWTLGHPLERISPYSADPVAYGRNIPPRCLIPTFPDDPKARFVSELEEATSTKQKLTGGWRTPKTLEQFWEMMAFRQECSSGQLTGFVWVVFDPEQSIKQAPQPNIAPLPTPNASFTADQTDSAKPAASHEPPSKPTTDSSSKTPQAKKRPPKKQQQLVGPIVPRKPRIKTHNRGKFPQATETAHYSWPEAGRGHVVLEDSGYTRAVELLLHLEFSKLDSAVRSTARWVSEVNVGAQWGSAVLGRRSPPVVASATTLSQTAGSATAAVNNLSGSMIRRKRPAEDADGDGANNAAAPAVNTLGAGLVRKKAKTSADENPLSTLSTPPESQGAAEPAVTVLGAGLVRKKARPAE